LDIDHGSYPFVTSSNTTLGGVASGSGFGVKHVDYILGVIKAYTTRVGAGPFPTELANATGKRLAERGHEFGSVTQRPRRCGWLDVPILRRNININNLSALSLVKLDVMDGLEEICICTHYRYQDKLLAEPPQDSQMFMHCEPVYETLPGWSEQTSGVSTFDALPDNAKRYIARVESLAGVPIHMISTGPDREETIILKNPLEVC